MPYHLKEEDHKKVVIIIPIYQSVLKDYEMSALKNNLKVLAKYPAVFLKPKDWISLILGHSFHKLAKL